MQAPSGHYFPEFTLSNRVGALSKIWAVGLNQHFPRGLITEKTLNMWMRGFLGMEFEPLFTDVIGPTSILWSDMECPTPSGSNTGLFFFLVRIIRFPKILVSPTDCA